MGLLNALGRSGGAGRFTQTKGVIRVQTIWQLSPISLIANRQNFSVTNTCNWTQEISF